MWLLPVLHVLSALAARTFYRLTVVGPPVPRTGPVLLVANHPNALLDPVVVAAAARRPVRLLAKAPLFDDWRLGWLVRAAGAIAVHRRTDEPAVTDRNVQAFDTVAEALADRAVVGIFPEGRSHNEPALARLKTGAARMALETWVRAGVRTAIVPVGLVFRDKTLFRSRALAVIGHPVDWSDLTAGPEDRDVVATLTDRIEERLRHVTINTERWADRPLVECAEAVWAAERVADPDPRARLARLDVSVELLAGFRRHPDAVSRQLMLDLANHCRGLRRLRLRPSSLNLDLSRSAAVVWALRRWYLVLLPTLGLAGLAVALFTVPYRVTDTIAGALTSEEDERSTYKLLGGIVVYGVWVVLLGVLAGWRIGWWAALGVVVLVPVVGRGGLWALEQLQGAWADARRFLTLRGQRVRLDDLRRQQRDLAARLTRVYEASTANRPG